MWYRRVHQCTLRTQFCISPRVLGRASTEIQSGVRFFMVAGRRTRIVCEEERNAKERHGSCEEQWERRGEILRRLDC